MCGVLLVPVAFGCVPGPTRLKMPFPPLTSHVLSHLLPEAGMGSGPYIPSANITALPPQRCGRADDSLVASVQQDQEKKAAVVQGVGEMFRDGGRTCSGPQSCKPLSS